MTSFSLAKPTYMEKIKSSSKLISKSSIKNSFKIKNDYIQKWNEYNSLSYWFIPSMSTPNSTWFALHQIPGKIIWITDKNTDMETLIEFRRLVFYKVFAIISLEQNISEYQNIFSHEIKNILYAHSVEEAVQISNKIAKSRFNIFFESSQEKDSIRKINLYKSSILNL